MKKILIVEDSVLIQKIIHDAIEACFPCEVTAVGDGGKAYDELSTNKYDLIITDIVMPVMDGLTLAEKVRIELAQDIPIIMLTSLGVKNVRDSTSASGVNAYLTKPIDTDQLVQVVNRLFKNQTPPENNVETLPPEVETLPPPVAAKTPEGEDSLPDIDEWSSKIDEDW
jgi:two-component system chemotaxis response regulator CheY